MDVRSIVNTKAYLEHGGTAPVWDLVRRDERREATRGGHLAFVCEFEVQGGRRLEPHRHNLEEYYYILYGRGIMTIEEEEREVIPGDLIRIPPNALHSIRPQGEGYPIHALCFAIDLDARSAV